MTESRLAPSFLPATAVLEMTYACNHACTFCSCPWYAKDGSFETHPELTADQWKQTIAKLCGMGCTDFAFTGGEPLLKDGIEEIIEFAAGQTVERIETEGDKLVSKQTPPKLYLLSNGKAMSDDILKLCKTHDVNLSMSLPGYTTFPEHTCGGMDADHVLEWFRKAKKMDITTTVGITVTNENHFELFETISQALLAGADLLLMNRFMPGGRGLEHADRLTLSSEQILDMLDTAEDVLQTANRAGSVGTELPKCILGERSYERLHVGTRCSAALDFFVIGPSGYVRVCNHSPKRLNHVDDIESLKDHDYWKQFVFKDYLPEKCGDCSLITDCDGGCREAAHVVGGQVDSMDPLLFEGCGIRFPR
jgi:radical SAM protein with 4Fe4S-binding SPASM domain